MHQAGALLGQIFLFARLRVQLPQLFDRMLKELTVARRLFGGVQGFVCRLGRLAPGFVGFANSRRFAVQPAITVQQGAVSRRVDQPARFELALDFDQPFADLAQQADTGGLVVDEGAAAPIGAQRPAQHQLATGTVQPLLGQ